MGSVSHELPKPWIETPCIFSAPLSRAAGCKIYLKLDNLQPSGSFKSRGIGNMMFRAISNPPPPASPSQDPSDVHFYCSSAGNAGLACATSALALGRPATIVVPDTTSAFMVAKLRSLGADVRQAGHSWAAADAHLRADLLANHDPRGRGVYVPPFDHPDIWSGASSLVDELADQFPSVAGAGAPLDAIVCNVGGGGLLCGIMEGLERHHGDGKDVSSLAAAADGSAPRVLAVETVGADSLHASVAAGELVTLPKITSIATSLGALRVAEKTFEWTRRAGSQGLVCATVTDAEAVMGSVNFLEDARVMVEVACGATIATVYNGVLRRNLGKGMTDDEWAKKNVVVVVCGGSNINLDLLHKYREQYGV